MFQVASATATRYGLSRGLLGLKYDQINYSDSDSVILWPAEYQHRHGNDSDTQKKGTKVGLLVLSADAF